MTNRKRNRGYWTIVLASTLLTIGALFALQEWHRSFIMLSSGEGLRAEVGAEVTGLQGAQREALSSGQMPIDRAMRLMAERGRTGSALVSPEPSTNPAPASGWLHHPDYVAAPQVDQGQEEAQEEAAPLGGDDEDRPPVESTRPDAQGTLNPQPAGAQGQASRQDPQGEAPQDDAEAAE